MHTIVLDCTELHKPLGFISVLAKFDVARPWHLRSDASLLRYAGIGRLGSRGVVDAAVSLLAAFMPHRKRLDSVKAVLCEKTYVGTRE